MKQNLIAALIIFLLVMCVTFFYKYRTERAFINNTEKEVAKIQDTIAKRESFVIHDTVTVFEPNYDKKILNRCDTSIFRSMNGEMLMVVHTTYKLK